jgi:glycosyltransferase involved in cell wall biosynthesis
MTDFKPTITSNSSILGLVSVIIPTHNRAHIIIETLDSVKNSTYRPLEIIVVDDGSTDDTETVLTNWARELKGGDAVTFKLISQAKGRSASAARNRGFVEAQGEFIHFLDSDDCLVPEAYEIFVAAFHDHPACGYVWAGWQGCDSSAMQSTLKQLTGQGKTAGVEVHDCAGGLWSGVFKREIFAEVGLLDERLVVMEDWEFQSRVVAANVKIRQLWRTLIVTRNGLGSGRLSSSRETSDNVRNTLGGIEGILDRLKNLKIESQRRRCLRKRLNRAFWDEYVISVKLADHALAARSMAGLKKTMQYDAGRKQILKQLPILFLYLIGLGKQADDLFRWRSRAKHSMS